MIPIALTIAGSDSSGGAGIQADLKTFAALKVYGTSVITAVTAQNTRGVAGVFDLPEGALAAQLDSVMSDLFPSAIKIGMLSTVRNVETVAATLSGYPGPAIVLDPVITATSGTRLLAADAVETLRRELFPLVSVVTPNLDEAAILVKQEVRSISEMEEAARRIHAMGAAHVLVTGGHLHGDSAVDVFFDGTDSEQVTGERIQTPEIHGTGCVLSAAIAGYLAQGRPLREAVHAGKTFAARSIRNGLRLGVGPGSCDPLNLSANPE